MSLFSSLGGKMLNVHPLPHFSIANQSQYWGLDSAVNNEKISLEAVTGDEKQNWVLELVEPSPGR